MNSVTKTRPRTPSYFKKTACSSNSYQPSCNPNKRNHQSVNADCLRGQNVAWSRSMEIIVMFSWDATRNKRSRTARSKRHSWDECQSHTVHSATTRKTRKYGATTPANTSATARLTTRYVPRLRRLRFLIETIIVMRFSDTIVTDMTTPAASQVAHSGNENIRTARYLFTILSREWLWRDMHNYVISG